MRNAQRAASNEQRAARAARDEQRATGSRGQSASNVTRQHNSRIKRPSIRRRRINQRARAETNSATRK
eukprot:738649-Lingulodinium_polyedra.AAC.1